MKAEIEFTKGMVVQNKKYGHLVAVIECRSGAFDGIVITGANIGFRHRCWDYASFIPFDIINNHSHSKQTTHGKNTNNMTKEQLISELRGNLTPIKNYLAMQRESQQPKEKSTPGSAFSSFLDGYTAITQDDLNREQRNAEACFPKVELLIDLLSKLG